jgi:hypothetical protein
MVMSRVWVWVRWLGRRRGRGGGPSLVVVGLMVVVMRGRTESFQSPLLGIVGQGWRAVWVVGRGMGWEVGSLVGWALGALVVVGGVGMVEGGMARGMVGVMGLVVRGWVERVWVVRVAGGLVERGWVGRGWVGRVVGLGAVVVGWVMVVMAGWWCL